jgi:hypothetical protein
MIPRRFHSMLRIYAAVAAVLLAQTNCLGDYEISRETILNHLKDRIKPAGPLRQDLSEEQLENLLGQISKSAEELGRRIIPETLSAGSQRDVNDSIPTIFIYSENMDLNRLLLKKSLMDININIGFQKMCPDLSDAQVRALEGNITQTLDGMRRSMLTHIGEHFTKDQINHHLQNIQDALKPKITAKTTYAFKRGMDSKAIDDLLAEFDRRLGLSAERVTKRLAEAEKIDDRLRREAFLKSIRQQILMEITSRVASLLAAKTVDPELAKLDPEVFAPGYRNVVKELALLRKQVTQEQRQKQRRERTAKHLVAEAQSVVDESSRRLLIESAPTVAPPGRINDPPIEVNSTVALPKPRDSLQTEHQQPKAEALSHKYTIAFIIVPAAVLSFGVLMLARKR